MVQNDIRVSFVCWVVAGIPVLSSVVQAVLGLTGTDAEGIPVLATLKQLVDTITVFDVAGEVFRQSPTAVFVLFLLVAGGWVTAGITMFLLNDRQYTYAASGIVTFFVALFLLVYAPLFQAGVPLFQLGIFAVIPVLAIAALWAGVRLFPWTTSLRSETAELTAGVHTQVDESLRVFETRLANEIDETTLEWLSTVSSDAVATFETNTEDFRAYCETLQRRADEIETDNTTAEERLDRAQALQQEVQALDPDSEARTHLSTLRTTLAQELRHTYNQLEVQSEYGEVYAIRNMKEYGELDLRELGGAPIQIGGSRHELGERLADATLNGLSFRDLASAVDKANSHITALEDEIESQEQAFITACETTEQRLAEAKDTLSRLSSPIEPRLREMLFEKRFEDGEPPFPTEPDILAAIRDGKQLLHDCRFDRAQRTIAEASTDAEQIRRIAIFFTDGVHPTIEHGSGTVSIPSDVGPEIVEALKTEVINHYDVTFTVTDETVVIAREGTEKADGDSTPDVADESLERPTDDSSDTEGPVSTDDVQYLLYELRERAADSHSSVITIQLAEYPDRFGNEGLLTELRSFCERQSEVERIDIPDQDPGFIKLAVADGTNPERAIATLYDRYSEQFG